MAPSWDGNLLASTYPQKHLFVNIPEARLTPIPHQGRLISSLVQYPELRKSFDDCLKHYAVCSEQNIRGTEPFDRDFWVIDVFCRRVSLEDHKSTPYAALRYVWGKVRSQSAHFENMVSGRSKKWLVLPTHLPTTLKDAIDFCRGLNFRYLWIDAIFIDQENQGMKDYLIPRMNNIYSRVLLTLIAAFDDDANAGLPGVRWGARSDEREVSRLSKITIVKTMPIESALITN